MKKAGIIVIMSIAILVSGCAAQRATTPDITPVPLAPVEQAEPQTDPADEVEEPAPDIALVLSGSAMANQMKILKVEADPQVATIMVPLFASQLADIQAKGKKEANWQIFASYAWLKQRETYEGEEVSPQSWVLEYGDYSVLTKPPIDGYIPVKFAPPQKKNGTGWYHVRIWGQGKDSGEWLWINQSDSFTRNDTEKRPAYEVWIHFPSGKWRTVPEGATVRQ